MALIQVISRISPVNMWTTEVFSKLSTPEQFGSPSKSEVCYISDPRTGVQYRMETSFIFEKVDSTKKDPSVAFQCMQIPGLLPVTSDNSALKNSNESNGFYTLNVPKVIKKTAVSTMLGTKHTSDAKKDASIKLSLKAIEKEISVKEDTRGEPREDLLRPLLQYFVENECLICGFIALYESEQNNVIHMATHIRRDSFACDCCNRAFRSVSELYRHKIDRTKKKPYVCEVCNKKFKRNYFLTTHMGVDHAPRGGRPVKRSKHALSYKHLEAPSFICVICRKKFNSVSSVLEHKACHAGIERLKCLTCSKTFFNSSVMKDHHHVARSTNDNFKCKICKKRFSSNRYLEEHKNLHKRKQLFSCVVCSEKFYLQSKLIDHQKRVHAVDWVNPIMNGNQNTELARRKICE